MTAGGQRDVDLQLSGGDAFADRPTGRPYGGLELLSTGGDSLGVKPVTGYGGDQVLGMSRIGLGDLTQLRDLILERLGWVCRKIVAPAGLDEFIG